MKTSNAVLTGLAVAVIVAGLAWAIDVDVSGETVLPNVDVEMTEGEMPEVDVETIDVDVERGEKEITVPYPDVNVEHEEGAQDGYANEHDLERMSEEAGEMADDAEEAVKDIDDVEVDVTVDEDESDMQY